MDRFVVLVTTTDQPLAERCCAALEEADIPVMLEHVEIHDGTLRASGYRLMVPAQLSTAAHRIADRANLGSISAHPPGRALIGGMLQPGAGSSSGRFSSLVSGRNLIN